MIEYWKKTFKDSWLAYINNWRLIIGAVLLSFSPTILTIFTPDLLVNTNAIDYSTSTLTQTLKSFDISIIIFFISIIVLIMVLLLGTLKIAYKILKKQPTSIKEITNQVYVAPQILLIWLLFEGWMTIIAPFEILMIEYASNLIFKSLIPFYILIVITQKPRFVNGMSCFYQLVKNNIILIVQFIGINILFGVAVSLSSIILYSILPILVAPLIILLIFSYIFLSCMVQVQFYIQIERKI